MKSPFDPAKFVDEQIINDFKDHFMFISCIDYICKVKTGHFGEHSNQLWSITAVPSWVKINAGLVKMYQKEVRRMWSMRIRGVHYSSLASPPDTLKISGHSACLLRRTHVLRDGGSGHNVEQCPLGSRSAAALETYLHCIASGHESCAAGTNCCSASPTATAASRGRQCGRLQQRE